MSKSRLSRITSVLLTIALLAGILSICIGLSVDRVYADDASDYYSKISATSGTELLGQLHDLITETHTKYTTYKDCKDPDIVVKTDQGSTDSYVMDFYTHQDMTSAWEGGNASGEWNREHVWCKSLSGGLWTTITDTDKNGGSDLHHIRPVEHDLNSTRNNNKYGELENGKEAWSKDTSKNNVALGGYYDSVNEIFEPLDNVKGDVARILMYIYTHYNTFSNVGGSKNGSGNESYYGTLTFTNIVHADSEEDAKALLLKWNKEDPVDSKEIARNDAVYAIQGNRNPFIDNSDYANLIWSDDTSSSEPSEPAELTSLSISPSSTTLSLGGTQTLKVIPTPSSASKDVTWTSSDTSVATVTSEGVVTGVSEGTVTITATSTENNSIKATSTVKVSKTHTFTITVDHFNMTEGYSFKDWSSGGITGIAYIYYSKQYLQFNKNQSSYYLASTSPVNGHITSVTVKSNAKATTDRQWKLLTSTEAYGEIAGKPTTGNDHGEKTVTTSGVTWSVDGNDTFFALTYEQPGTSSAATYLDSIEVTYENNDIPQGGGEPTPSLESLSISPNEVSLDVGGTQALAVTATPETVDSSVTWTSSDSNVATVSADGVVSAVASGSATITATSSVDSSISASVTVTVKAKVATIDERVDEAEKEISAITKELDSAKTSLNQALTDIESNSGSIDDLNEAIEELNIAIANAETTSKTYADTKDAELKSALEQSIASLNSSLSDADALQQRAIDALTKRLDTAEANINNLTQELNSAKASLNKALDDISNNKGSISELNSAIDNLESAISNAESASKSYADSQDELLKSELEDSINTLKATLTESDSALQTAITALDERITSAETNINNLTRDLDNAKESLNKALADISNNKSSINELNSAIDYLETAISNAESASKSYADSQDKLLKSELEDSIASLNASLSNADALQQDAIDTLNARIASVEEKITALTNELNTAKTNLSKALADIENNTGSISELNKAIDELKKAIENAQGADSSIDGSDKSELDEIIESSGDTLKNALSAQFEKVESNEQKINDLNSELDATNEKVDALSNTLGTLQIVLIAVSIVCVLSIGISLKSILIRKKR